MGRNLRSVGLVFAGCVIGGAIVFGAILAGWPGPQPRLPPLLTDVTAGGGWWGACPPETTEEPHLREGEPLALSPELDQRLAQAFPPGSSEKQLLRTLREQGFEVTSIYETARGISDEQVIEIALKYDYLLLTEDKDSANGFLPITRKV